VSAIDPNSAADVGAALLAWAQRTFGGAVTLAEPPQQITGGLDTYIHRFRLAGPVEGLAAGPLILRLYPSAARGQNALREAEVLRFLTAAGYRAPRPLEASASTDDFGLPYVVMELVPGKTFLDRVKDHPLRAKALLTSLAEAQAALHRIDPAGWPFPPGDTAWEVDRRLAAAEALPAPADPGLRSALAWLQANRERAQGEGPSLCHWDFHPMNALVDDEGTVAVIDWEGAGVGDRHSDLARTLVLFEWAQAIAGSRVERVVLGAVKPWLIKTYRRAYARQLPVDDERLHYWMALHAADSWAEAERVLSRTLEKATRTETREGPARLVAPAMAKLFRRLVPEAARAPG
jgi:aminoglycoside phosphotransferase (APT) family kinase protein